MNHSLARELLPGYVLGALEVREQEDLLQHLQFCAACYQRVQEAMEVAAMLARTIPEADPPVALKAWIQASLAAMPPPNNDISPNDQ